MEHLRGGWTHCRRKSPAHRAHGPQFQQGPHFRLSLLQSPPLHLGLNSLSCPAFSNIWASFTTGLSLTSGTAVARRCIQVGRRGTPSGHWTAPTASRPAWWAAGTPWARSHLFASLQRERHARCGAGPHPAHPGTLGTHPARGTVGGREPRRRVEPPACPARGGLGVPPKLTACVILGAVHGIGRGWTGSRIPVCRVRCRCSPGPPCLCRRDATAWPPGLEVERNIHCPTWSSEARPAFAQRISPWTQVPRTLWVQRGQLSHSRAGAGPVSSFHTEKVVVPS